MTFNYQTFENSLEYLLGQGVILEWQGFGVGHYRINGELDVWPRRQNYHFILTGERGQYRTLGDFF